MRFSLCFRKEFWFHQNIWYPFDIFIICFRKVYASKLLNFKKNKGLKLYSLLIVFHLWFSLSFLGYVNITFKKKWLFPNDIFCIHLMTRMQKKHLWSFLIHSSAICFLIKRKFVDFKRRFKKSNYLSRHQCYQIYDITKKEMHFLCLIRK